MMTFSGVRSSCDTGREELGLEVVRLLQLPQLVLERAMAPREALGHDVERGAHRPELVVAAEVDARREVARGDGLGRARERRQRTRQRAARPRTRPSRPSP
jgi:hypothetical protein